MCAVKMCCHEKQQGNLHLRHACGRHFIVIVQTLAANGRTMNVAPRRVRSDI